MPGPYGGDDASVAPGVVAAPYVVSVVVALVPAVVPTVLARPAARALLAVVPGALAVAGAGTAAEQARAVQLDLAAASGRVLQELAAPPARSLPSSTSRQ